MGKTTVKVETFNAAAGGKVILAINKGKSKQKVVVSAAQFIGWLKDQFKPKMSDRELEKMAKDLGVKLAPA
ncbi:hypothetical protein HN592_00290 [Candidatus Woesearchaeota archaeon]|jgi:hypothetical protein|nr:hypothetical protein [Candidatus Woesearchaeota archaeon]MBT4368756.1 hypothetical protein [Candidatus Woesearchaeota archaeon]MBT4712045.1 hypothetical protein [Candidatus Woesearchaeota archaeon]MBT6639207.1 hypothetical protein [Candidatus Woesearchaeota archaeon]MBT7134407.1 hypothetical protein [Candidatus Woesearchaeota archaeon]